MRVSIPAASLAAVLLVSEALAAPQGVVVSEFRVGAAGGSGNDEFIELLNTTVAPVAIGGWILQGCAAGSGAPSTRATIPAGTVLAAGGRYLFANGAAPASLVSLANQTYATGIADNTNSGLRLLSSSTVVEDGVGMGVGQCVEGMARVTLAGTDGLQSFRRVMLGGLDEAQDSNNNLADFEGPVTASPGAAPGPVTPPPQAEFKRIHEIQGAQHRSPLEGQRVRTRGIVSGVFELSASNKGFYIQDPDGDGIDATSEGLLVFTASTVPTVSVGQEVSVTGSVTEFRPGGASTQNLTTTELTSPTVVIESNTMFANALAPTVIGLGGRVPPNQVVDDDTTGGDLEVSANTLFDPANDGVDFYESLEGMWVQINEGLVTGPTNGFGEVFLVPDGGVGATGLNARGGITLNAYAPGLLDYNPERIQIDDEYFRAAFGDMPDADVGDIASTITGVVSYNFGNFEVLPMQPPVFTDGGLMREVSAVSTGPDRLTVANYNVENLDPSDGAARFAAIAAQIVGNLGAPDIVALQEVQDNSGAVNDGITSSDQTLALLVEAIRNTPGVGAGPQYTAFDIAPLDGTVGGEPGGNIRVAYLYKADRVQLVGGTAGAGDATTGTTAASDADGKLVLTLSPGLVDPGNAAFAGSRKPLAAVFEFNGNRLVTINNHWSSKGGSSPILGRTQPFVNGSEAERLAQAQVVRGFVDSVLAIDPDAKLLVLGDLNEFTVNAPVRALTDAGANGEPGLVDLADALIAEETERYSYVFEGNAQSLDHILASPALMKPEVAAEFDAVHINAEFHDQISDHDPDLVSFLLARPAAPLACVAGPGDHVIDRRSARFSQIITGKLKQRNVIFGSRHADLISGGTRNDCIDGGAGSDLIFGLGGDDVLLGGEGNDLLSGVSGKSVLDGGAGRDQCLAGNQGQRLNCE